MSVTSLCSNSFIPLATIVHLCLYTRTTLERHPELPIYSYMTGWFFFYSRPDTIMFAHDCTFKTNQTNEGTTVASSLPPTIGVNLLPLPAFNGGPRSIGHKRAFPVRLCVQWQLNCASGKELNISCRHFPCTGNRSIHPLSLPCC